MDKLCQNKTLLNSKGLTILKKLCSFLPVERVYIKFADVLLRMKDYEFVSNMINILDIFLLTYKETDVLRKLLKNSWRKKDTEEKEFFEKLFATWSFNPISTLILCIISEYFELSYYLLIKL
jgi:vacuole morphology and inheritance protein 14